MKEPDSRKDRISIKDFKLSTLLELTTAINNNVTEERLFSTFEYILKDQLKIGKAVIYRKEEASWTIPLKYGVHASDVIINIEEELKDVRDITVLETGGEGTTSSFDVVIPVFHLSLPLAYLFLGDLDEDALGPSPIIKHLSFIQTLANITSVAVENKRLELKNIEQERILQELHMASQMQEMLLPKVLPDNNHLQVSAYYRPHQEVGGDFYDIIQVSSNETVFCMADVSGKGMPAAIVMANFQANLRALLKVESNLKRVIHSLNDIVWDNAMGERYITCFLARYDRQNRKLSYVNAAHPPGLLLHEGKFKELEHGSTGIGMFEKIPRIDEGFEDVKPGTVFFCYTDGISEAENEQDELFQDTEMKKAFRTAGTMKPNEINPFIIRRLDAFRGNRSYRDDIALISCLFI